MPRETGTSPRKSSAFSWILYDLANTVFSFNIISFAYPLWLREEKGLPDAVFAVGNSVAMAVVVVLAPVLGTLSDRAHRRIPFLIASTLACVGATAALGLDVLPLSLVLFGVALIAFEVGLVFYDALLPIVSTPKNRGRVGGLGVGVGYLGSVLGLSSAAVLLALGQPYAVVFAASAALFLLFALPIFALVREPGPPGRVTTRGLWRESVAEPYSELRHILRGRDVPHVGRFLIGRFFYTDAANTMIIFMTLYITGEGLFTAEEAPLVLLTGIGGAALLSPFWGMMADRAGPKHTLDAVLLTWMFGLLVVALVSILDLPREVFFPLSFLLGGSLGGTWSADRPLLVGLAPRERLGRFFGFYSMMSRFAAILGPLVWALVVDVLNWGRPTAVLSLLLFMVVAFVILRPLPDPAHPGASPLGRFLPWRAPAGAPRPLPTRWWLKFPATLTYCLVTTALYFAFVNLYHRRLQEVPEGVARFFIYKIPELTSDPGLTLLHFFTGIWVNHHPVQLVYVLVLLVLFGMWVEIREGTKRAVLLFFGTSIAAGIAAGFLLHILRASIEHPWLEEAWTDAWVGGSAGAFGLMGVYAARAERPWLLIAIFLFWEINVEAWHLQSYTPAFHLPALAIGFVAARYFLKPRAGPIQGVPPRPRADTATHRAGRALTEHDG